MQRIFLVLTLEENFMHLFMENYHQYATINSSQGRGSIGLCLAQHTEFAYQQDKKEYKKIKIIKVTVV